jgi:hypothetical protein
MHTGKAAVEAAAVKRAGVKSTTVKPAAVKSTAMEPATAVKPSASAPMPRGGDARLAEQGSSYQGSGNCCQSPSPLRLRLVFIYPLHR